MDSEQAGQVGLLLRIFELSGTVCKALALLAERPEDASVRETALAGLGALRPFFSGGAFAALDALFAGPDMPDPQELEALRAQFSGQSADSVCKELSACLRDVPYLERAEAERLFAALDEMDPGSLAACTLMFDVCERSAVSLPRESFRRTMALIERRPGMLSGEGHVHPEYVYRPAPQRSFERCPVCGGGGSPYYRALSYRMGDFSHPHLPVKLWMRCASCGNLYTWQYPEAQLALSERKELLLPAPARRLTATRQTNGYPLSVWGKILRKLSAYTAGTDLLEVGVGTGELLAAALELGYSVDAVEIDPSAAQAAADLLGIPVWAGDFLEFSPEKRYSVITMGDVIEHITDPGRALRNAYQLLEDGGALWLSTPNYESGFSRLMKFSDPMWMEPYHITYFSFRGFRALAERCGFEVREYEISQRYNGSMELILTKAKAPAAE